MTGDRACHDWQMSDDQPAGSADSVFSMDPQKALWSLARQFVDGQRVIAELTRTAHTVRNAAVDNPAAEKLLADYESTVERWLTEALPGLAASMQLTIEVYETFGAGLTRIEDPTDAAIWNNKYFVWVKELGARSS